MNEWTDRGCPVAVLTADAVVAAAGDAGAAGGGAASPVTGERPGDGVADTLPGEAPYTAGRAYEDGYDQGA